MHIQVIPILTVKLSVKCLRQEVRQITTQHLWFNEEGEMKRHKMICLWEQRDQVHQQILILCSLSPIDWHIPQSILRYTEVPQNLFWLLLNDPVLLCPFEPLIQVIYIECHLQDASMSNPRYITHIIFPTTQWRIINPIL